MQCQRLNSDGVRCKRKAVYIEHYHGDHEIYYLTSLVWVEIYLCGNHKTVSEDSENFIGKLQEKR